MTKMTSRDYEAAGISMTSTFNVFTLFQIEKVGSDGSKEETEVEAARRQQRLTLIASARGDGGSKNGGQYVPVHHSVIPTPSEQLQLTLTLSAQTKIQKETSQMRTSIISTLRSQVRKKGSFSNSFFFGFENLKSD